MDNLFKEEETKDTSATAIKGNDTRIQRMSKGFAKKTLLQGDITTIMTAYQRGAKDMKPLVMKELCRDCPSKGDCAEFEFFDTCDLYRNIFNLFDL